MQNNNYNSTNNYVPPPPSEYEIKAKNKHTSPKKKRDVMLLSLFFGTAGVHDFYAGNKKNGIIKLLLMCSVVLSPIATIWNTFDLIKIFTDDYTDGQGRKLQ